MARGNIQKRGESSWRLRIYLGTGPDGKQKYYTETVHGTKKAAQQRLTELLRQLDTGGFVEPTKTTFGEFVERWLEDYQGLRPNTRKSYEDALRVHIVPALSHIPLAKLRPTDLASYYSAALRAPRKDGKPGTLSSTTVAQHHRIIHRILETAVRWGLVARNVADAVEPPRKAEHRPEVWTPEEARRFMDAIADHRLHALYVTAIMTGMRRGELLALRWSNVNLDAGWLSVQEAVVMVDGRPQIREVKSKKSRRRIDLPPELVAVLRQHRARQARERLLMGPAYEDNDLVFCQPNGRMLWPNNVSERQFKALCKRAGVRPICFHELRHSHASFLLAAGVHPKVVSERLGHSTVSITLDIYSHILPTVQGEAAAAIEGMLTSRKPRAV